MILSFRSGLGTNELKSENAVYSTTLEAERHWPSYLSVSETRYHSDFAPFLSDDEVDRSGIENALLRKSPTKGHGRTTASICVKRHPAALDPVVHAPLDRLSLTRNLRKVHDALQKCIG
jgi:hypothetical protein